MKKIFCFNGHPGAGKDAAGKMLISLLDSTKVYKMAEPIGAALKATFDFSDEDYLYHREIGKSEPVFSDDPSSPSFRTCMIDYGEKFLKKTFYPEIFAHLLFKRVVADGDSFDNIIITDIGFQREFNLLCSMVSDYNKKNKDDPMQIYLYRINRPSQIPSISFIESFKRRITGAKNFIGDSREWVYKNAENGGSIMIEKDYNNDGTLNELRKFIKNEIKLMELF